MNFSWKDYCPTIFRNLREMFNIDAADYMMSISGGDGLRELSTSGKSGSLFYVSLDDKFVIKTLRTSELKVLLKMLPSYYNHVKEHENTLVTKFYGLHEISVRSGKKVQFVVMGNMFYTQLRIHRRYDLKGSSQGRNTNKDDIREGTTFKDLDLSYDFHMDKSVRDVLFKLRVQLGVNMPAQANRKVSSQDNSTSTEAELFEVYDVVLYLGVIDILQGYNTRKKIELAYKSMKHDPMSLSVSDPKFYSERFYKFLEKVFPPDT
uniref:1-phosphatidylinositol-4-phosphate 5-kinase n=1 Tax=Tanacetum cinerariifolium TaxID=118510 RepID=A0A699I9Y5_TANCI|nr:phosphatidylinositol 4-phosphate 5-kinase 8-like isoform X1 [Tanacetum cinerariifolium]